MATRNALYTPLTLAVLALVIGPIGIAVFVLGFGLRRFAVRPVLGPAHGRWCSSR